MIYFDYKHVTQNSKLEKRAIEGLQEVLEGDAHNYHCKFIFYRVFTDVNKVRDVVEMNINLGGESTIITRRAGSFKKALQEVIEQLKRRSFPSNISLGSTRSA